MGTPDCIGVACGTATPSGFATGRADAESGWANGGVAASGEGRAVDIGNSSIASANTISSSGWDTSEDRTGCGVEVGSLGIRKISPHFAQRAFCPANFSLTRNLVLHEPQRQRIDMTLIGRKGLHASPF
jgi:hypothetical protein